MKIEPFLVASTVKLVIAQRLARRICTACRVSYVPTGDELTALKHDFQLDAALNIFRGKTVVETKPVPTTAAPAPINRTMMMGPTNPTSKMRVVEPEHNVEKNKTILERMAEDPNIINRSMAEAEAARAKAAAPPPPPVAGQAQPASVVPDQTKLKGSEFILFKAGPGCDKCSHNGYVGRIGLFEVMEVNDILVKMIVSRAHPEMIEEAAVRDGMITLSQDGLIKCLRGETSIEEVLRVTREIDR
jgi:type II secretory ATPase GspE/PulE/Tfp pilus assembly ATPase PilB-like protein